MATTINGKLKTSKSQKTVTTAYLVTVDVPNDHDSAIAAVSALAAPSGYHLDDCTAVPGGKMPVRFEVVATYMVDEGSWNENPLSRPSVLTTSYDESTEEYFIDSSDARVLNSALDRFETMPQRRTGKLILTVVKNYPQAFCDLWDGMKYTRNSGGVTIKGRTYPAKTLLMLPTLVSEQWEKINGVESHYFTTTFRLAVDFVDGHEHVIEDRGTRELVDGKLQPILDSAGVPVTVGWPLNADGTKKAVGAAAENVRFEPYPVENWGINFD